ncbi:MAG: DUF3034 family protein [Nevskia sp.]|nr:DUF3034 family protein [Nevskia sp.]
MKASGSRLGGRIAVALVTVAGLYCANAESAGFFNLNTGKVWLTNGAVITDGASGGGINPWATIGGMETRDGINATVHYTYANLPSFTLNSVGLLVGLWDRVELSYAWDTGPTGSTYDTVGLLTDTINPLLQKLQPVLSLLSPVQLGYLGQLSQLGQLGNTGIEPFNTQVVMNVVGLKIRVFGDAIYNSDNLIPQVAIGGFYKWNANKELLHTLGASKRKDFEAYISATKIFFPISTLISATGRYTSANQTGLVGFGGPDGNKRTFRGEFSVAYLLNKQTALGAEYAMHSNNLHDITLGDTNVTGLLNLVAAIPVVKQVAGSTVSNLAGTLSQHENDWKDIFFAYAPNKNLTFVFAYAMLGQIVLAPHNNGVYMSVQANF